jgi:glycosyltransferase involved in cell wall biosynthesis
MRILVALHNFLPNPCFGAERVAIRQVREMLRLGHEVGILFAGRRDPSPADLVAEGLGAARCFRVSYVAPRAQVLLSIVRPRAEAAFARALRTFQPDAVLFHHLVRLSLRLPEMARRQGVPSVLVLHDHYLVCPSHSLAAFDRAICQTGHPRRCAECLYAVRFGGRVPPGVRHAAAWLLEWRRRLVPRQLAAVDRVIAPSRSVIEQIEARGVGLRSAVVIPNGSDPPVDRRPLEPKAGGVRFGYLGATLAKKGIDVLAEACAGALSHHVAIRGFRDRAALAAFRGRHPDCHASLDVFSPGASEFIAGNDVVLVPSICLENQPTTIVEAFAHGRPVVASRIGGIPEMFDDGRGGWLVPPGDARALRACMERLLDDPQEICRVAARIPAWPRWADVTAAVVRVLEDAVAGSSRMPGGTQP